MYRTRIIGSTEPPDFAVELRRCRVSSRPTEKTAASAPRSAEARIFAIGPIFENIRRACMRLLHEFHNACIVAAFIPIRIWRAKGTTLYENCCAGKFAAGRLWTMPGSSLTNGDAGVV